MFATPLDWVLNLLILQGLMGAFDTLYHHELTVGLPQRPGARKELTLHAVRALLYGVVFAALAHVGFHGLWVAAIAALVLVEVGLTLWDFVVEDNSRKLPSTERVLHTVLAINGGALFGLYAWQLADWASLPSALVSLDTGWRGCLLSLFAAGIALSGVRDALAARKLGQAAATPNPFADLPHQRVLVTGGTGFIGEALVSQLLAAGHNVTVLARDPLNAAYLFHGRARCVPALDQLHSAEQFDAIINLAGAPVVGPRWSPQRKAQLLASRVGTTQALQAWLARATHKPATWIQASAIGYYGVRPADELLHEDSRAGQGFMTELCARWEESAQPAQRQGLRLVTLRLGLVFGPGGALLPLLLPHRFGLGGRMGNGRQIMSWVHRDDVLGMIARALGDGTMQGTYNAVAPEAISQADFAQTIGRLMHRPVFLHLPAAPLRLVMGEMAQLFFDGQRVVPHRLQSQGYVFRYPTLAGALRALI
ncbi:epimerase [Chitinimonas prasina]|uniref:Epimerase n=1 Tax=Chitinimonas prasina TaxID=1434937 RepID=A0ABQ5YIX8_9NEIS|nr:TIGR01777 family oxidoreductase [Chitinimonas prasina]GLR13938.1 epimerase [Chitinimonas prasina]